MDSEEKNTVKKVWFDVALENLKDSGDDKAFRQSIEQNFEKEIEKIVLRLKEVPSLFIAGIDENHSELLAEARELFIFGRYYSCVVMCAIVAEGIAKQLLIKNIQIRSENEWRRFSEDQIKYIEKIGMEEIRELLIKSKLINESLRSPFKKLFELRNAYTHARGSDPEKDAKDSIGYLSCILNETMSVF